MRADEGDAKAADEERFAQAVLEIDGAQMPLISSTEQADLVSPFDDPKPGESIVLVKAGDLAEAYAVTAALDVRRISAAQLVAAAECEPNPPAQLLPGNPNARVMKAVTWFRVDRSRGLGRGRRGGE